MTDHHPERWDVSRRLRTSRDYAALKSGAVALRGRHALLLALVRPGESTRIGFIASRRGVGGAVQRNRARRRLREIVRRRFESLPPSGHWLAFVAYRSTLSAPHEDLVQDVETLLTRASALIRSEGADA